MAEPVPESSRVAPSIESPDPAPDSSSSLGNRVRRGTLVSVTGQLATNALQLGSNLVLTRLLLPQAFGLMAIVNLMCDGLQTLSDIGIQPAVIRSPNGLEPKFLQTAFTLQALRGVVLFVIGLCLAYPLSRLYDEPRLTGLMSVASLSALILGFQSIHLATTARKLQLERPMIIQVGARFVATLTTIAIALVYPSVWALVFGLIAGNLARAVSSHLYLPGDRSRLRWDPDSAREIVKFGQWILLSMILGFIAIRADVALLGRLLPLELLGVYSIGTIIPNIVRQLVSIGIQRVLMPALAELYRFDGSALNQTLAMARRVLLPISSLLVISCVTIAPAFFTFLYDPRYHDAAWIAQLTVINLWFGFLQDTSGRALLVLGNSRGWATCVGVRSFVTVIGALVGFWLGTLPGLIIGVGLGAAAGYFTVALFLAPYGIRVVAMDMRHTLVTASVASTIGFAPVLIPQTWLSPPLVTALVGLVFVVPYAIVTARRTLDFSRATAASTVPSRPGAIDG